MPRQLDARWQHAVVASRLAAPVVARRSELRAHEAVLLEPAQSDVNRRSRQAAICPGIQLVCNRNSVGVLAQPQNRKQHEKLQVAQRFLWHGTLLLRGLMLTISTLILPAFRDGGKSDRLRASLLEMSWQLLSRTIAIDTNVFVAAGFNPSSAARQVLARVERRELDLVWNARTRNETEHILTQIPRLDWADFSALFREELRLDEALDLCRYTYVSGELDREFLALAEATGAILVTNDSDLLIPRDQADVPILTPSEFLAWPGPADD